MPSAPRRVWITRAEPGASATAARLIVAGFEPVIAPLLATRSLPDATLDLNGVGAVAFTSAQAIAAFVRLSDARPGPVFAVGQATAEAARSAGFEEVISADGDVTALAALIADNADRISGVVLHPGAAAPAGDLAGDLAARGLRSHSVALYETLPRTPPAEVLSRLPGIEAALVYSPRAATGLASILNQHPAPDLRLLALSEAVAAPLRGLNCRELVIAPFPNEPSLLNLL